MAQDNPLDLDLTPEFTHELGNYKAIPIVQKQSWKEEFHDCFWIIGLVRYVIFCPCYCCAAVCQD